MITNNFDKRHIGPRATELDEMLQLVGVESIDQLIDETVPSKIRMKKPLNIPDGMNEYEYFNHIKDIASKNKLYKSFIGLGYYNSITPGVILRNILENPGWYTSYTPYQAEISQGRLEALLNFQTMVIELTGLPLANASLLDEATAAAEAMIMFYNARPRPKAKAGANKFYVCDTVFPHTIDVLIARAKSLKIELVIGSCEEIVFDDQFFGMLVQYPDQYGSINDYRMLVEQAHDNGVSVAVTADLLSLTLLTPPGEWGADVVCGTTQRFGIPMGYGGPHAAYFATTESYKRNLPGRIIGISQDKYGEPALRMALQTREQHIKRERATSNICTAQALLATMAGMYAVYHGKEGLLEIANDIHNNAVLLANEVSRHGYTQLNETLFDTLRIQLPEGVDINKLRKLALDNLFNFRYISENEIGISIDETTSADDVQMICNILAAGNNKQCIDIICEKDFDTMIPEALRRTSSFLEIDVFQSYQSETDLMRYIKKLENKDLALNRTMIPLGSCTMKLNAAAELFYLSWPEFGAIHPFVPNDQAAGYLEMINTLEKDLCEITGFSGVSFMPNSGASGEYTGLKVIKAFHEANGEHDRDICLIPSSAHGTNPASAVMAGMKVVVVKCDEQGNIDLQDLQAKAEQYKEQLAAIMITYPSTHGVFEEGVLEIMEIIHSNGGQVYMDGANMNAQVGLTNPGLIGADVCHLNLHKTFAIPHGGGGPGVGPIGVAKHLKPFLPKHIFTETGGEKGVHAVAAAPYGSASILGISYAYIKLLGADGLTDSTKYAILNANYLKSALDKDYKILYTGENDRVAHEMIIDCNEFLKTANLPVVAIAKRLMDYGFHAPTVAFPVIGTLMVEPTESEPLFELNRFVEAMKQIREEIREIERGNVEQDNNVVLNAPHTDKLLTADSWELPYTREKAAYPVESLKGNKYWPPVAKIDDAFGDRNLVCSCKPIEDYE